MSKPKLLFLTVMSVAPNEKGEERVNKALEADGKLKKDEHGHTAEWYEDMGLSVPKDLLEEVESEIDENGMINLDEDEIDYIFDDCIIKYSEFKSAVGDELKGVTTVYTENIVYEVSESVIEIYEQIYLLKQTWFEKIYNEIKWRVKRLINKEKDLVLELKQEENNN